MASQELFGVFREEKSIHVNDPFKGTKKGESSRFQGKQFKTHHPKTGQTGESYIDPQIRSISQMDPFKEPEQIVNEIFSRKATAAVSDKPFKPSRPAKKSTGLGDGQGCIGPVEFNLGGTRPSKAQESDKQVNAKSKIYTKPQRKGGFGYPYQDRTIGNLNMPYVLEEYQTGRIISRKTREESRARILKPFVPSCQKSELFGQPIFLGASGKSKQQTSKVVDRPWKPSNPPKKGAAYSVISKSGRNYQLVGQQQPERKIEPESTPKAFKQSSCPKARLSMWTVNPYDKPARPQPSNDFTLLPG